MTQTGGFLSVSFLFSLLFYVSGCSSCSSSSSRDCIDVININK